MQFPMIPLASLAVLASATPAVQQRGQPAHEAPIKEAAWPPFLPGHGNLTINATALAAEAALVSGNSSSAAVQGVLMDVLREYGLPGTIRIARPAAVAAADADACEGAADLGGSALAGAVQGVLCLGADAGSYDDVARAVHDNYATAATAAGEVSALVNCGCTCKCQGVCNTFPIFLMAICLPFCLICDDS